MRQKAILALSALLFLILIFSGCELFQCNCICDNYDAEDLTLNDTVANDLRFELIDVLPYPEADKDYQLDDYILLMHISD